MTPCRPQRSDDGPRSNVCYQVWMAAGRPELRWLQPCPRASPDRDVGVGDTPGRPFEVHVRHPVPREPVSAFKHPGREGSLALGPVVDHLQAPQGAVGLGLPDGAVEQVMGAALGARSSAHPGGEQGGIDAGSVAGLLGRGAVADGPGDGGEVDGCGASGHGWASDGAGWRGEPGR